MLKVKNWLICVCCFAALFFPLMGLSQKNFFSLGAEIGIPKSEGLKMVAGTLTGASLRIESSFGSNSSGLATIGYLFSSEQHPFPTTTPATTSNYKVIPVQVGVKYYTVEKEAVRKGFFISGELGLFFTTRRFSNPANPDFKHKEADLVITPGIGYLFGKAEPSFRLHYNLPDSGFKVYYFDFRLAYTFRKSEK